MSPENLRECLRECLINNLANRLVAASLKFCHQSVQYDGGGGKPFRLKRIDVLRGTATLIRSENGVRVEVVVPASSVCYLDECAS